MPAKVCLGQDHGMVNMIMVRPLWSDKKIEEANQMSFLTCPYIIILFSQNMKLGRFYDLGFKDAFCFPKPASLSKNILLKPGFFQCPAWKIWWICCKKKNKILILKYLTFEELHEGFWDISVMSIMNRLYSAFHRIKLQSTLRFSRKKNEWGLILINFTLLFSHLFMVIVWINHHCTVEVGH